MSKEVVFQTTLGLLIVSALLNCLFLTAFYAFIQSLTKECAKWRDGDLLFNSTTNEFGVVEESKESWFDITISGVTNSRVAFWGMGWRFLPKHNS